MTVEYRPVEVTWAGLPWGARDRVEAKLAKINKRLAKLGAPPASATFDNRRTVTERTEWGFEYQYDVVDVTVTGVEAFHGGWQPVASLDHTYGDEALVTLFPAFRASDTTAPDGTVERGAPVIEVPEHFRHRGGQCDTCGVKIGRHRTILFVHDDGSWTQVGTSCVLEFFGVDPATVLWLRDAYSAGDDDERDATFGAPSSHFYIDPHTYLSVAAAVTTLHGFVPTSAYDQWTTKDQVNDVVYDRVTSKEKREHFAGLDVEAHRDEATAIIDWVLGEDDRSDFMRNAQIAVSSHKVGAKTEGILSALPSVRRRALAKAETVKAEAVKPSEFVGTVGDKLTLVGTVVVRVAVETHYGMSLRLAVRTDDGDKLTTFGSGQTLWGVDVGDRVEWTGKVKGHSESAQWGRETEFKMVKVRVLTPPAPTVPDDWQRLPDAALEELIDAVGDDHELYDDLLDELRGREAMRSDPRIAEAMGAPWLVAS